MTDGAWEIVGQEYRDFRSEKTVGEALSGLIRKRWKNNAAKLIERSWGLDPKTAKNIISQGNVSERTLTKAAMAERWALWNELGEEMFGETYADYLRGVINEFEESKRRTAAQRDHIQGLEERASRVVALLDGKAA